jgi:LysM repeat protein
MAARNRARYLAPIALLATIAGTYAVIHSTLNSKSTPAKSVTIPAKTTVKRRFARAKYYFVRNGDSLSGIAAKTGIALSTLEGLNKGVDPNALQTGQRLRLRR